MKNEQNKKTSVAMITNDLNINGISTVVANYCMNIDLDKFDITVIAGAPIDAIYKQKFDLKGIHYVELPARKSSSKVFYRALYKEFRNKKYDIAHIHGNSATITIELLIAWLNGIKVRIAHCHNSTCDNKKIHRMMLPLFKRLCTGGLACSDLAGQWLFKNGKYEVLPNGFYTERFCFNDNDRSEIRKELNIDDKFVIGHIGRFNNQKNHPFLLEVFKEVGKERKDAVLLLVGNGPNYDKVMQIIDNHPYKDRIIVYGETTEAEKLYSAMDVFAFPTKHEGLGIVLLEAQISGLKCVVSDVIPHEVVLGDSMVLLSLDDDISKWKDAILKNQSINRNTFYKESEDKILKYDIRKNVKRLEDYYINALAGKKR